MEATEVRAMLHDVLDGWNEATVQREKLILLSLNNIDHHLDKLNGKVAAHQKIINDNLPHNVTHCLQSETIKELKEGAAVKDSFEAGEEQAISKQSIADALAATNKRNGRLMVFQVIALCLTLAGLIVTIYKLSIQQP